MTKLLNLLKSTKMMALYGSLKVVTLMYLRGLSQPAFVCGSPDLKEKLPFTGRISKL